MKLVAAELEVTYLRFVHFAYDAMRANLAVVLEVRPVNVGHHTAHHHRLIVETSAIIVSQVPCFKQGNIFLQEKFPGAFSEFNIALVLNDLKFEERND